MGSISCRVGPFNLNVSFKDMERFFKVWQKNLDKADKIEEQEKSEVAKEVSKKKEKKTKEVSHSPVLPPPREILIENITASSVDKGEEDPEMEECEVILQDGTRVMAKKLRTVEATPPVDPFTYESVAEDGNKV